MRVSSEIARSGKPSGLYVSMMSSCWLKPISQSLEDAVGINVTFAKVVDVRVCADCTVYVQRSRVDVVLAAVMVKGVQDRVQIAAPTG